MQLQDLLHLLRDHLQVHLHNGLSDGSLQCLVAEADKFRTWEDVFDEPIEALNVLDRQFRQGGDSNSLDDDAALVLDRRLRFRLAKKKQLLTGYTKDRLQCPQAPVVVLLDRQQLPGQCEERH